MFVILFENICAISHIYSAIGHSSRRWLIVSLFASVGLNIVPCENASSQEKPAGIRHFGPPPPAPDFTPFTLLLHSMSFSQQPNCRFDVEVPHIGIPPSKIFRSRIPWDLSSA